METATFPNFLQPSYPEVAKKFSLAEKWNSEFFESSRPLVLELGCGKGEYTVELARKNPGRNYIGIDRKGARMWKGAKTSVEENLINTAFLRTHVEMIGNCFGKTEVDEIWITFPDPFKREGKEKKRLTSSRFLKIYGKIMKPGGIIHLKTDDEGLFQYTLEVIRQENHRLIVSESDLYHSDFVGDARDIRTYYEEIHLRQGKKIKYIQFALHEKKIRKPSGVSDDSFFSRVYEVVKMIPYGKVTSYGAIAGYLGIRGSARMVGWAMNASHHALVQIPAHRVVNRNGLLTGKMHFGGPEIMRQLLESEGIRVEGDKIIDFEKHFWNPGRELDY